MKNHLIHTLLAANVSLEIVDGNLKVNAPKGLLTKELLADIKENKEDLIKMLTSIPKIPASSTCESYPTTSSQKRFWVLSKFEGGNNAYNISNELEFNGPFDKEKFLSAFKILIERHEILRTSFKENEDGEIRQYILPYNKVEFNINFQDVSKSNKDDLQQIITNHYKYEFDLSEAPLLSVEAVKISFAKHLLLFNLHHMIGDGWSLGILSNEVIQIYNALQSDNQPDLPSLPLQYRDYAVWLESDEQQKRLNTSKAFWLENLGENRLVLNLPSNQKRPSLKTYNGATIEHTFSKTFSNGLRELVQNSKASIFMGLMASINGLFYRYTNSTDIILGTAVSGREHPDLSRQIGLFINTLAIRTQFQENEGFEKLVLNQKSQLLEIYKHQSYPFYELVEQLNVPRDPSRSVLFDVMVLMQNQNDTFERTNSTLEQLEIQQYPKQKKTTSQFDLNFSFKEREGNIEVVLEYNTDIFNENFIRKLLGHLENFVIAGINNPMLPISDLDYVSKEEKNELLKTFNDTQLDYPEDKTVLDLFKEQVLKNSNSEAIVFGKHSLTYSELDQKSNQLAAYLNQNGIKQNDLVALCVDRSLDMILGIIGILKSGASYVPVDPSYPIERIDYIIKDSQAALVLTKKEIKSFLPENDAVLCIDSEEIWNETLSNSLTDLNSLLPAYTIYTSGTTGKPKGVTVSHKNLLNFFIGLNDQFEPTNNKEIWLAVTSMSFDISILEMIWTLIRGSKVIIQNDPPTDVRPAKKMDFGLFYFAAQEEIDSENKYDLLLKGAAFADENELKSIWVPERHFHSFGDQFPNPSIAAAAVAATTKNVSIRSGSVVLPLHDPVRIAEEWSMVDNLSDGRVELSIASGWHPNDFVLAPDKYENRHEVMKNGIETLKELWRGGTISRKNGTGDDFEFKIHPKPIQDELQIWTTVARSVETFKYAGSIGANILTHLLGQNIEDLEDKIKIYRETLEENGFDPEKGKVAIMLHTFVSDDMEYVKKVVKQPFKNYLRQSLNLMRTVATEADLDLEKDLDTILELGFQRFFKTSGLFGSPQSCVARVNELTKAGVNEIACLLDFGIDTKTVLANLPHLKLLNDLIKRNSSQYDFIAKKLTDVKPSSELIISENVTNLQATPTFITELLTNDEGKKALKQINTLLIGGEALPPNLADELLDLRKKAIYNMYGPTETTIWTTIKKIDNKDAVNIGKPMANTQVYILDKKNQLCPIGITGELCIGGDGVSMGYKDRKNLNVEKFIDNPFVSNSKQKIYKTGDLAKWLPSGELSCLGRIDNQVKLRGHRIELQEIENVLLAQEGVKNAAVVVKNIDRNAVLVAYIVEDNSLELDTLKVKLRMSLPLYMLPGFYMKLDTIPLTPNGKTDKNLLPEFSEELANAREYVAPKNEIEEKLVAIWEEILGLKKISTTDDFFELGGHSLKAINMRTRINKEFDLSIEFTLIFKLRCIAEMAEFIADSQWERLEVKRELIVDKVTI